MQENIWLSIQSIENFKYKEIQNTQIRHFFLKSEDRTLLIYRFINFVKICQILSEF